MSDSTKFSTIHLYSDEFDEELNDAIERFEQHNIRLRTPNRNVRPKHKQKQLRHERE